MYQPTNVQLWTTWLFVYAGTPLAWASVLLHMKTPWRETEMGRHLFTYACVIAAIMTFVSIQYWYKHPLPGWLDNLRFGVYAALIFVMGWRVVLQCGSRPRRKKS